MDKIGGRSGAGQGRCDLARDMPGLAHATDDDAPFAAQDHIKRVQETLIEACGESLDSGGFDAQNFARKIECARRGGNMLIHAAHYNSGSFSSSRQNMCKPGLSPSGQAMKNRKTRP